MSGEANEVGTGVNLFTAGEVCGVARWFNDTSDVLSIDDDDLEETIAFVSKGGMTFLSPILPDLKGIVCTAGDELLAEIRGHLLPADAEHKSAIRKFGARLTAYAVNEHPDGAEVVWSAEFRAGSAEEEAGLAEAIAGIYGAALVELRDRLTTGAG